MRPVFAASCLILLSLTTGFAQQIPSGKEPTPLPSSKDTTQQSTGKDNAQGGPAQAPTPPDYSQEAFVVQHFSETMRFENDGTGRDQTDAEIKIMSESGVQALGQLKVGYSALSDKLEIAYVRVHKQDGTVVTAQESAIQDLTFPDAPVYTDYHEKHISVPSLRPGDVLEYRFIRTTANPLDPGQFWTSYNFSEKGIVLEEQLEINVPKDRQIKLKTKPGFDAKITEEGDRRIYRWSHARLKDEDESAKKKKKKGPKPDDEVPTVQLTTFKSWQELGAWYAVLERDRRIPDSAVKAEADALVKGKTDNMAKVKALYDYVSRNIRYVSLSFGLGRIQPHAVGRGTGQRLRRLQGQEHVAGGAAEGGGLRLYVDSDWLAPEVGSGCSIAGAVRPRDYAGSGRRQRDLAGQHAGGSAVPHAVVEFARERSAGHSSQRQRRVGVDTDGAALRNVRSHHRAGQRG